MDQETWCAFITKWICLYRETSCNCPPLACTRPSLLCVERQNSLKPLYFNLLSVQNISICQRSLHIMWLSCIAQAKLYTLCLCLHTKRFVLEIGLVVVVSRSLHSWAWVTLFYSHLTSHYRHWCLVSLLGYIMPQRFAIDGSWYWVYIYGHTFPAQ